MMNIALIKAGGVGSRMGAAVPKQFITVYDKPVVVYTLEAFQNHPDIDAIVVVCVEGWHGVLRSYIDKYGMTKVISIVNGGETSLKSIRTGVHEASRLFDSNDTVLIHDANRPLVTADIISGVLAQANLHGSAVAAIHCTDEAMESTSDLNQAATLLDHTKVFRIQTPDAYRLGDIHEALQKATEDELSQFGATNTYMLSLGKTVFFAPGSELNIRLTTQDDIYMMESLLKVKSERLKGQI